MPDTKIKRPNKVYFHRTGLSDMWQWEINYSNGARMMTSDLHVRKGAMLRQLAELHGMELSAGRTVINGRQHNAWRWDLDAALVGIGLKPYAEEYTAAEATVHPEPACTCPPDLIGHWATCPAADYFRTGVATPRSTDELG